MGYFIVFQGDRFNPSPAFPAAEPVARVASQHCPTPSGSGRLSINRVARRLNQKAANGNYPLNFVSHNLAHRHVYAGRSGALSVRSWSRPELNRWTDRRKRSCPANLPGSGVVATEPNEAHESCDAAVEVTEGPGTIEEGSLEVAASLATPF